MIAPNPSRPTQPRPRLVCIDPGSTASGVVVYDGEIPSGPVVYAAKVDNIELLKALRAREIVHDVAENGVPKWRVVKADLHGPHVLVVEMIASYGMPVGAEVFETCVHIGRCLEAWSGEAVRIYRREVNLALCNSPRANDATIRQAILDRFGGKDRAVGRKATPGPLYAVKADAWAALALGITYTERGGSRVAGGA